MVLLLITSVLHLNQEKLDVTNPDWLTDFDAGSPAFVIEADGSLTSYREAHTVVSTEFFSLRSARTNF